MGYKEDGANGCPVGPTESPNGFSVSGGPKQLTDKSGVSTGSDQDSMSAQQRVDGRPGGAPTSREAVGQYGGLGSPRKTNSSLKTGKATIPDVPITGDPANVKP